MDTLLAIAGALLFTTVVLSPLIIYLKFCIARDRYEKSKFTEEEREALKSILEGFQESMGELEPPKQCTFKGKNPFDK